jgi:hypothetical protein
LNHPEFPNAALLALDMLAKGAEGREARSAIGTPADVEFLLVCRTRKVLIQSFQIGTEFCGINNIRSQNHSTKRRWRCSLFFVARISSSNEARGIGNNIEPVVFANESVYGIAVDARRTTTSLEVKDEVRVFDERHATKGAVNVLCTVDRRSEMISQVVFILEMPIAGTAVGMSVRLSVMFLQPIVVREYLSAGTAVAVGLLEMLFKVVPNRRSVRRSTDNSHAWGSESSVVVDGRMPRSLYCNLGKGSA